MEKIYHGEEVSEIGLDISHSDEAQWAEEEQEGSYLAFCTNGPNGAIDTQLSNPPFKHGFEVTLY